MGHWRDGGIGNMAGSDDRPAEEFTLLEKLTVIAGHSRTDAQFDVADTADEAFEEIQRLREIVERDIAVFTIIAGSPDRLIAAQAATRLANIGPAVKVEQSP